MLPGDLVFRTANMDLEMKWKRFGRTRDFALDVQVYPALGQHLWASMRWWVGGRQLVHDNLEVRLCDAAAWGWTWLEGEPNREPIPEPMTSESAMHHYCEYVYSDVSPDELPYWSWTPEDRAHRRATVLDRIAVDALMDWWRVISVRTPTGDWILARDLNTGALIDHQIPSGETRRVVQEFCTWASMNWCKEAEPHGLRAK
jgi:hypothetical protein